MTNSDLTQPNILEGYISRDEFARQLGRTPRRLQQWEKDGLGPDVTRLFKGAFYRVDAVKAWLKGHEKESVREHQDKAPSTPRGGRSSRPAR